MRQRHVEPDPKAANAAILEDLAGGAHVAAAADPGARPGRPLLWRRGAARRRSKGVFLDACADCARRAREHAGCGRQPDRDLARGRHQRERAARRLQLRSAGRAGRDRHALLSGRSAPARSPPSSPHDCRTMSHVTALLADGRPYHEAGGSEAQELAAMLATLVAYLRACEAAGLRPRMALGKIAPGAGGRRRPVPDHRQAARRAPAGGAGRRGLRRRARGREASISRPPPRSA